MSQYLKECIFCKGKIQMSDKTGKWLPYNEDGSQHDCKKIVPNKGNKRKEVRIGSITDDLAEMIAQALDDEGIIIYRRIRPKLIDVFTETSR